MAPKKLYENLLNEKGTGQKTMKKIQRLKQGDKVMTKVKTIIIAGILFLCSCSDSSTSSSNTEYSSDAVSELSSSSEGTSSTGVAVSSSGTLTSSSSLVVVDPMSSESKSSSSNSGIITNKALPISLYMTTASKVLQKTVQSIDAMKKEAYDIDLDTINATTEFWFIIVNNGDSAITGLKITSDHASFKVTPDTMVTLSPLNGDIGMITLIKVTIEHGISASGLENANLLTGDQYSHIKFSGNYMDSAFSVTYTMHSFAKRMVVYLNVPDTVLMQRWDVITSFQTPHITDSLYLLQGHYDNPTENYSSKFRYVYVDANSNDCYVEFSNNNVSYTVDSSFNKTFKSMTEFEALSTEDVYSFVVTDSVAYNYFVDKTSYTTYFDNYSTYLRDRNCATLVIDNYYNTQYIVK